MASLKTASRRPSTGRTYRDVDEMLRRTGYRRVAAAVKSLSAKTRLVDQLILARVAAGLTQGQLAAKLRCSQSRISKMEDSEDAELSLGDLKEYASAVGLKLKVELGEWVADWRAEGHEGGERRGLEGWRATIEGSRTRGPEAQREAGRRGLEDTRARGREAERRGLEDARAGGHEGGREARTRGREGTIVDWLIGWPVGKGEAGVSWPAGKLTG